MLCTCVVDVMDVVFSVCIMRRGAVVCILLIPPCLINLAIQNHLGVTR